MRILVVDNYDSFVYNLVQYLGQLGVDCDVRRNDEIAVADVGRLDPTGILLSPGPGTPQRAGICLDVIREYSPACPTRSPPPGTTPSPWWSPRCRTRSRSPAVPRPAS
jgi:para-aminobenzoate synthetase component 2